MPLVAINNLTIGYRGPSLLDEVSCLIEPGQRIGLLGRNGAGKTTLLRLLSGQEESDRGEIVFAPGTKVALLQQEVPQDLTGTSREIIASGLTSDPNEPEHAWKDEQRIEQILEMMQLDAALRFETLSAGRKRRVLLARALVSQPDLLLLDEPTNHLDVESIRWLEVFLQRWRGTFLFVTHDRMFLRKLSNRILEIDRGKLFDWSCDYDTFLKRKEEALAAEEKQNALFDRKLAEEEVWIRTGIQARRTRNEGRVRALEAMRRERSVRRTNPGQVEMTIQEGQRSGNLIAALKNVTLKFGERTIIDDFSTTVMRGDKIGILGPNGAGKTTLLKLLLGQLEPTAGSVKLGTNLQIAYFDQLRAKLDGEASVADNAADGSETIKTGEGSRHVIGYLQDFLFTPERARTPVKFLSGGERNRLLLAKLFAKPANTIVLDEPTNDLDAETLELLEERLVQFQGTILVVSHDREFLNNVVTTTIAFEHGGIEEYVGGYDDWVRQHEAKLAAEAATKKAETRVAKSNAAPIVATATAKKKLSYKDQQELDKLPQRIADLEAKIAELHDTMGQPAFYQQAGAAIAAAQTDLKKCEDDLALAYERWEILESA